MHLPFEIPVQQSALLQSVFHTVFCSITDLFSDTFKSYQFDTVVHTEDINLQLLTSFSHFKLDQLCFSCTTTHRSAYTFDEESQKKRESREMAKNLS